MKKILFVLLLLITIINAKEATLYERIGGYKAISALLTDFHIKLKADPQLARFWKYRGTDGEDRELQLLVDYVCKSTGGPVYYSGRDMGSSHIGMMISESDWKIFIRILKETVNEYHIKDKEQKEILTFVDNLKSSIVEVK